MLTLGALFLWIVKDIPSLAAWLPSVMVGLGIPFLIGSALVYGRYRKIYDHEPIEFLGKDTNGKTIRRIMLNLYLIAAWLIIFGALFYLLAG
jgi:hypothetical protein